MTAPACPREQEVEAAVLRGWVDGGGHLAHDGEAAGLQAHVEACAACADVLLVASMLRAERDVARHDVQVPAAGQVWWRAAIRARHDETRAAARPLTWVHGAAAACAAGFAAALLGMAWPSVTRAIDAVREGAWVATPAPDDVARMVALAQGSLSIGIIAAACALLAPLLYLVLSDD